VLGNRQASQLRKGMNMHKGISLSTEGGMKRTRWASRFTLALAVACASLGLSSVAAQAGDLQVTEFSGAGLNADLTPSTQAGARPHQVTTQFSFNTKLSSEGLVGPAENVKDLQFDLPPGFVGNIQDFPQCPQDAMDRLGACPVDTQIGFATINVSFFFPGGQEVAAVYNVEPPPGMAAQFAFVVVASVVHVNFGIRTGTDYGVTASLRNINETAPVWASKVDIWGVPADPSHDGERFKPAFNTPEHIKSGLPLRPLLSNPTACGRPLVTTMRATTWQLPSESVFATPSAADALTGCDQLEFNPKIEAKPTTNLADSPAGLEFHLQIPQNNDFDGLATAQLRDSTVVLPPSLTVNPSSANGLGACSPAQIGLKTPPGQVDAEFTPDPANCPDASKIGTVRIDSPSVLDHFLTGDVYLAAQNQNPFGSLLAMYIAIDDRASGVVVKLPALIEADQKTGQLTAKIVNGPQLPYEDVRIETFKGAGAPLKTGIACGAYEVNTDLVPWTAPEGATAHPKDSFQIEKGVGGGACAKDEASAPNKPSFEAGTFEPTAGAYTPFTLKLARADGTQQLTGIDTTLPKGLIAKLAGVPYCSDQALSAAVGKSGRSELANPSCPAASKVGSVFVSAGAGPSPFHTEGSAYLAGPYKGAPLSLAVVTPAVAGPFDLGDVVVRNALYVDPESAQVRAVSDPFPSILQGIPLDLRSVAVNLDRSKFTRNPTSCNPLAITGSAALLTGQSASLSNRFQVGDCGLLAFKPKLSLTLKGGTKRNDHPALKAVLTAKDGEANIAGAAVTLPRSEFLENAHIKTICTRVQFAANACPARSVYGKARAFTPLLDKPLEGPVYLRSSSHELPDLVADLNGQIHVVLVGRIDSVNRGIRNTFEAVPDAPVSKFVLEMQGGKKGLLVNNRDLCKSVNRATVLFDGQNGKTADSRPAVGNSCKKKARKGNKGKKRSAR
jgi:hypothetical protein